MISKTNHKAHEMSMIILENYVPENHLLRKVDRSIDFRFIYELVEPLYAQNGRPSIDPIVLFKLLFINHLYGYNSMRRTIEETKVNLAYRWFIGYGVEDPLPHFSDFSKNYTRKFSQTIEVVHPITGVLEPRRCSQRCSIASWPKPLREAISDPLTSIWIPRISKRMRIRRKPRKRM